SVTDSSFVVLSTAVPNTVPQPASLAPRVSPVSRLRCVPRNPRPPGPRPGGLESQRILAHEERYGHTVPGLPVGAALRLVEKRDEPGLRRRKLVAPQHVLANHPGSLPGDPEAVLCQPFGRIAFDDNWMGRQILEVGGHGRIDPRLAVLGQDLGAVRPPIEQHRRREPHAKRLPFAVFENPFSVFYR